MKRMLALLLAIVMCVFLCACGNGSLSEIDSSPAESTSPATEKIITPTFDPAQSAYGNIHAAYEIVHEFGSDLHNAWHMACYDNDKLKTSNTIKLLSSKLQYLNEDDLMIGLAFVLAKNKYQENWDELTETEKGNTWNPQPNTRAMISSRMGVS